MFFDAFPNLGYKIDDKIVSTKDIFRRVSPLKTFLDNDAFLEHYRISAGERPEDVAFALYKDPTLHWTILLTNNIIDPYNEWYYTPDAIQKLSTQRYGAGNEQQIHHYCDNEDREYIVDWDAAKLANGDIIAVTNIEYEEQENDKRQLVKVIQPQYIGDFINEFKRLIIK